MLCVWACCVCASNQLRVVFFLYTDINSPPSAAAAFPAPSATPPMTVYSSPNVTLPPTTARCCPDPSALLTIFVHDLHQNHRCPLQF
jgi:hypothetical protein